MELALYGIGGAADIWSASNPPPGAVYVDRSFAGPVVGPVITSACFAGADKLLTSKGHHGLAKVLRVGYAVGITGLVIHNKRAGRQ
jgi:hypothetical protein